jgi:hypothetical protein
MASRLRGSSNHRFDRAADSGSLSFEVMGWPASRLLGPQKFRHDEFLTSKAGAGRDFEQNLGKYG